MRFAQLANDVVVRAPAKVNLYLEVLGKRTDGYHEINTLMVAVRLYDTLIFKEESTGAIHLACQRPDLTTGPDNLIVKAARLLQRRAGIRRGATLRLIKRIPLAAGLGGGSSDAAATLAGLNRLWRLGLGNAELAQWSGELGSDVPFFFTGPAAWCTGRGEIATPLNLPAPLDLVLLCPRFGMSTPAVYQNLTLPEQPGSGREIRQALEDGAVARVGNCLFNRLQPAAAKLDERLGVYIRRLANLGPAGQLMSGSGSSLFALGRDREDARRIAAQLRAAPDAMEYDVHLVRSCSEQLRLGDPST